VELAGIIFIGLDSTFASFSVFARLEGHSVVDDKIFEFTKDDWDVEAIRGEKKEVKIACFT